MQDMPEIYKENGYEVIHSNFQIYVDLTQTEEQIIKDYRSNVRRNIRRAEREHLKFEIAEKSLENIEIFKSMYQKAMDILEARKFLYFNDDYFKSLIVCESARLGFVRDEADRVIASGIMLLCSHTVYYHLGCFDRDYSLKRPMNYLIHSMIMWSRNNGYETFHLGGGGESLRQFKEGYSSSRINYYIADKVCDSEQYDKVCNVWKNKFPQFANETYYPLYRYNE
jgi:CelD/BcsL family acetyltransferase involved in cellulose biosynthesis